MSGINWTDATTAATATADQRWTDAAGNIVVGINDLVADGTLPTAAKLAILAQLASTLANRDQLIAFANGRPTRAIGGGDPTDETALRQRITDLERELADNRDENLVGSLAYKLVAAEQAKANADKARAEAETKLAAAESLNEVLKKDRALLEAIAQEFGVPVPDDSNTSFNRNTAAAVKAKAGERVAAATPPAFDRAAIETDLAAASAALQAVKSGRSTNKVDGLGVVAQKLRDLRDHLGLSAPTPADAGS